ncbi:MAG TPA: phosphoribosylformylglycinamidine synthase [Bacteroidales bacterium]|nr:phosphoribosylformylglycinamidine synthase [Bacteroidales bacterium]HPO64915.1 phosphoribosylformylglycinamidine synthase [Bacteroidales bacterium]
MIYYFQTENSYVVVESAQALGDGEIKKLIWLLSGNVIEKDIIEGYFVGPHREMITPWSTNAVEITRNMGIEGIKRMEEFFPVANADATYDRMLQMLYHNLTTDIFTIERTPEPIRYIEDIDRYNQQEGLALNADEIAYLKQLSQKLGRLLTDSEIFGFSQVNSEHCRHKIFNGTFVIDGKEQSSTLFQLIKKTTQQNPNRVVSAYRDNCAFIQGPVVAHFSPQRADAPSYFATRSIETVISLKAETHNFPTTVEPFNGAATGTGGEIRDRMAGGKGAFPIAGTAVYMTPYPRNDQRPWEQAIPPRKWLYQTPEDILIKASNGASDFGNKYGQPLICGSVLTFEHSEKDQLYGYDKVIMLAGGVGFGPKKDSLKGNPQKDDQIVMLGGDNYRIGMGGGAVSSVATGEYEDTIELNAVQRSNPEMQKRVYNVVRGLAEMEINPIISIHDHGAGGHLNCFSELVEPEGGEIDIARLPVGDPTLSAREIIGNESQERMGLLLKNDDIEQVKKIAERERAPMYVVGKITGDGNFSFFDSRTGEKPLNLQLSDMFGNPPRSVIIDSTHSKIFEEPSYEVEKIYEYITWVLQLEQVGCKDWLTNKVDRSVTGRVAQQQTVGELQLPLSNVAVVALDYTGQSGIATAIGHAPIAGLIDERNGSILSIAEALTNIMWAPIEGGLRGVSLSANWMWPARQNGEDARLYRAVEAASNFALQLGINIPTGKDSLSMTQKYPDGKMVYAPGTLIVSAAGEVYNIRKVVTPAVLPDADSILIYVDMSLAPLSLGGSALGQVLNKIGGKTPTVKDPAYFANVFNAIQLLLHEEKIMAGHDISAGGLITTLLEMNFPNTRGGMEIDLNSLPEKDWVKILFSENPGVIIQISNKDKEMVASFFKEKGITFQVIGKITADRKVMLKKGNQILSLDINAMRDLWYRPSYLLDRRQSGEELALERYRNYKELPLIFKFSETFTGQLKQYGIALHRNSPSGIRAAIVREQGSNGDREMAWALYLAGFDVKDVHMTDIITGRETLDDVHFVVFVGGFANSDVLGSAKGWAGAFLYNPRAKETLDRFYSRNDTLSLGVCNGCQLMTELNLINPEHAQPPRMKHNRTHKFESHFVNVTIQENNSVMLKSLQGSRLGIWVAHGEGRFHLPLSEDNYHIPMKYSYSEFPGNPNGSDYDAAAICSSDGRHLAMMPHLERAIYPWNWAFYPHDRKSDEVSPWIEAFVNAREWIKQQQ